MKDILGTYRWLAYFGLLLALAVGAWSLQRRIHGAGVAEGRAEIQAQWDAANAAALRQQQADQARRAAEAQAASAAYEQQAAAAAATIKKTRHDLYVATENLASCRLSADSVQLLNGAADDAQAGAD